MVCSPPLWAAEQGDTGDRSAYAEDKCGRGRAWRWALYGGLGAAGAAAMLGSIAGVPLARRVRRSTVSA